MKKDCLAHDFDLISDVHYNSKLKYWHPIGSDESHMCFWIS